MDAAALVAACHNRALSHVAFATKQHFSGLRHAASHLKQKRSLKDRLFKQLQRLDDAYNVARHISAISVETFMSELVTLCQSRHQRQILPTLLPRCLPSFLLRPLMLRIVSCCIMCSWKICSIVWVPSPPTTSMAKKHVLVSEIMCDQAAGAEVKTKSRAAFVIEPEYGGKQC
eukprot:345007-Amphidinium_carterae.2